jgi:predicted enzyme related to lactoylglutathione lyase
MFKKFSHPMLYTNDLARAVGWYKEKLGFKENFVAPGAYASLRHEGMGFQLDLHPSEAASKDVGFGPIIYFVANDFDATLATLKARDVRVGTPKQEGGSGRFVTFWDSEGNALGFVEAKT